MSTASELDLSSLDKDPRLFLYTSLTAGSSHIITATSRMETILKANRIPFLAVDLATDEKCRRLWQRRGGAKKKLPGLVKEGYIIGDLEEVEEWNEFGELKENIGPVPASSTAPPGAHTGISTAPPLSANVTAAQGPQAKAPQTGFDKTKAVALPGAEEMAAIHKAKKADAAAKATPVPAAVEPEPQAPATASDDKTGSIEKKEEVQEDIPAVESSSTKEEVKKEVDPSIEGVEGLRIKDDEAASKEVGSKVSNITAQIEDQTHGQSAKDPAAAGQSAEGLQIKDDEAALKGVESKVSKITSQIEEDQTQEQSAKDPAAAGQSAEGLQIKDDEAASKEVDSKVSKITSQIEEDQTQEQSAKDPAAAGQSVED